MRIHVKMNDDIAFAIISHMKKDISTNITMDMSIQIDMNMNTN